MLAATPSKATTETLTRRASDGAVFALSSIGGVEYRVDLAAGTCQCAGFQFRGSCRHLAAATERYSPKPSGTPCHLCQNPFATGVDSRRIGGGQSLDRPICKLGDPGDHAA
jgi:SWIM zinc finger